jgi:hypothetical protein
LDHATFVASSQNRNQQLHNTEVERLIDVLKTCRIGPTTAHAVIINYWPERANILTWDVANKYYRREVRWVICVSVFFL